MVTVAVVAAVPLNLGANKLASLPAPGDLPSARGDASLSVAPSSARAGQVLGVTVSGDWAFVYSIDERVGDHWVKRWEGMGCGTSDAERAKPNRFWQLACPVGGPPEPTAVRLPKMADGTYRLRSAFFADPAGREQFELASVFTVA
jgi:hypothetical protein